MAIGLFELPTGLKLHHMVHFIIAYALHLARCTQAIGRACRWANGKSPSAGRSAGTYGTDSMALDAKPAMMVCTPFSFDG